MNRWGTRAAVAVAGVWIGLGLGGVGSPGPVRAQDPGRGSSGPRIVVSAAPALLPGPATGRLIVAIGSVTDGEPRRRIGALAPNPMPMAAVDVVDFDGTPTTIDRRAATFPFRSLIDLPPGEYRVQAVLDVSHDRRAVDAPGNYYSRPRPLTMPATGDGPVVALELSSRIPAEPLPPPTADLRFVEVQSPRLSAFHGRPVRLRAGVILPRGFEAEPARRYPVRVHIGGYGTRYTDVIQRMRRGTAFRAAWHHDDAPRMVFLQLDGAGPYGDPYHVNSANNGPYGDALVHELLPYVEDRFRGRGDARVLDGASTGGWVALALQMFYPDAFHGAWAYCPDSVDFRRLQVIDIYRDPNAFVDADGGERPSARTPGGATRFTVRHEVAMENVLGGDGLWTRSGRQWGAWNAAYGPRGLDGHPIPLFDPQTGDIDRAVARHWASYDLGRLLAARWAELAPKLRGKLRIWVGDADDYFLDQAVRLLEARLEARRPAIDARIVYGPGRGHCWVGATPLDIMREMGTMTGAQP